MSTPFEVLGLPQDASPQQVKDAYRELSKTAHPDAGGTAEGFQALKQAYEAALVIALRPKPCVPCGGSGRVLVTKGFNKLKIICADCGGSGERIQ